MPAPWRWSWMLARSPANGRHWPISSVAGKAWGHHDRDVVPVMTCNGCGETENYPYPSAPKSEVREYLGKRGWQHFPGDLGYCPRCVKNGAAKPRGTRRGRGWGQQRLGVGGGVAAGQHVCEHQVCVIIALVWGFGGFVVDPAKHNR